MREKLVYRSHFQPAPAKKAGSIDGHSVSSSVSSRRRSPAYRATKQLILRVVCLVLALILVARLMGWTSLGSAFACLGAARHVKTVDEWRQRYDDLRLSNLQPLPMSFKLPSGDDLPSVGLGTWKAQPGEVGNAVKAALKAGYRHFDCAWVYGNEEEIGDALFETRLEYPRETLFLTSKLWNTFHAPEDIEEILDETLSRLQTNYLDLYLIHWPVAFDQNKKLDEDLTANPLPTWKKLEEMVFKGKIRNIGVSNFNVRRIKNLTASDIMIRPAVNQVELNYWNPQPELVQWAAENGLVLEAYSPLGGSGMVQETLKLPTVKKIAKTMRITPAEVLISWHVQRGTVVLPKSVDPSRINEDFPLFRMPQDLFNLLETEAVSHPSRRLSDPSKQWGLDIFEDNELHSLI